MGYTLQGKTVDNRLDILENDSRLIMEKSYPPNQRWEDNGVVHLHPHQQESFEVLEGILSVTMNGEERSYVAGERFEIPAGTPHLMCNQGSKPVRTRWQVEPPMNTADFFETVYRLDREGQAGSLLQQAVIAWKYREIFKPLSPPLWIQPLLIGPLALIGMAMGHRV